MSRIYIVYLVFILLIVFQTTKLLPYKLFVINKLYCRYSIIFICSEMLTKLNLTITQILVTVTLGSMSISSANVRTWKGWDDLSFLPQGQFYCFFF